MRLNQPLLLSVYMNLEIQRMSATNYNNLKEMDQVDTDRLMMCLSFSLMELYLGVCIGRGKISPSNSYLMLNPTSV